MAAYPRLLREQLRPGHRRDVLLRRAPGESSHRWHEPRLQGRAAREQGGRRTRPFGAGGFIRTAFGVLPERVAYGPGGHREGASRSAQHADRGEAPARRGAQEAHPGGRHHLLAGATVQRPDVALSLSASTRASRNQATPGTPSTK